MTEAVKEKPGITILYRLFYALILGTAAYGCARNAYAFQGQLYVHLLVLFSGLVLLLSLDCFISRTACLVTGTLLTFAALYNVRFKIVEIAETTEDQAMPLFGAVSVREMWCVYLIAAASLALWLVLESFFILRAAFAAGVMGLLAVSMFTGNDLSKISVCMALLYIVSNVLELLEKYWEKRGADHKKAYFVRITPFLVLYFILIAVLPVRATPYDWSLARTIYRQMREHIYTMVQSIPFGVSEDFGMSTSGFSEGDILFSDLADNKKEVLHLKTNASFDNAVYLTGRVCDTFDGRTWKSTVDSKRKDVVLDTLETYHAVYRYDRDHSLDYVRKMELDAEYRFFHSKYLFTPLKTLRVNGFEESRDYDVAEGWYKFRSRKSFGTGYSTTYYVLNRRHPDFVEMIEAVSASLSDAGDNSAEDASGETDPADPEKAWNRVLKKQNMVSGVLRYEDLQEYRARMQAYHKPSKVSAAVRELLQTVYAGAETDYEKMVRLEEELHSFSYNTRPGKLPENVQSGEAFLDYFLLEKREGYCAYFATAFVLLAREAGLPARFVEGYCIPRENLSTSLETDVISGMAHAWPEVYFEGVGWIPFEPTPGFAGYRSTVWMTSGDRTADEADGSATEEDDNASGREIREDEESDEDEFLEPEPDPFVYDFMLFIICLPAGAAAIFVLFIILDAVREKVKTAGMDAESRFRRTFRRNIQILEAMGYKRSETETLSEFNSRLPEKAKCIEDYEAAIYGNLQIDEGLAEAMSEAGRQLMLRLKREKKVKYYFIRCLLWLKRAR